MLQRLGLQPLALDGDLVAVEIDAAHFRVRVSHDLEPEIGNRQAALASGHGLPRHLDEFRVQHVLDVAVNVQAERAQRVPDLRRGEPGAARLVDRFNEVGDHRLNP